MIPSFIVSFDSPFDQSDIKFCNSIEMTANERAVVMDRIGGEQSPEFYRGLISGYIHSLLLLMGLRCDRRYSAQRACALFQVHVGHVVQALLPLSSEPVSPT